MTQPTLPVLGGGQRELRDGDRVRLRCGSDVTINLKECDDGGDECFRGQDGSWWYEDGRYFKHKTDPGDIVLILGQAEETHGADTVTLRREVPGHVKLRCHYNEASGRFAFHPDYRIFYPEHLREVADYLESLQAEAEEALLAEYQLTKGGSDGKQS